MTKTDSGNDVLSTMSVVGVTVTDSLPVGVQHLRLANGLTAIYGKNGTGKSRLLRAVNKMLSAPMQKSLDSDWWRPSASTVLYGHGGIHVHCPVERGRADPSSPIWQWASDWLEDPWAEVDLERDALREDFLSVKSSRPGVLRLLDVTEPELDWLLAQGRWLYQPAFGALYLCDPDPLRSSPLADRWLAATDRYSEMFAEQSKSVELDPHEQRFGRLEPGEPEQTRDGFTECSWSCGGTSHRTGRLAALQHLMALPDIACPEPAPDWVAYPIVAVTTIPMEWPGRVVCDWQHSQERNSPPTFLSEQLTAIVVGQLPHRFASEVDGALKAKRRGGTVDTATFDSALAEVTEHANMILADLFEVAPRLHASRRGVSAWLDGRSPIDWSVSRLHGRVNFSVDGLGSAHQRYVQFAVERSIEAWSTVYRARKHHLPTDPDAVSRRGSVLIVDEPERALHPAAEHRIATRLQSLADHVVVATHSLEVQEASARSGGAVYRIDHAPQGFMTVTEDRPDVRPSNRRKTAQDWGTSAARVAALTRVLVFVEGRHDKEMIEHLLDYELRRDGAVVNHLGGTRGVHLLAETAALFDSSDAPVLVCLDNGTQARVSSWRRALENSATGEDRVTFLDRERRSPLVARSPELLHALDLLHRAVAQDRLDRIHLFTFKKRDIVEYLPAPLIVPGYENWKAVNAAFLAEMGRTRFEPGDGERKKKWANDLGGNYHLAGIRKALKTLDAHGERRHREFDQLAMEIHKLASS